MRKQRICSRVFASKLHPPGLEAIIERFEEEARGLGAEHGGDLEECSILIGLVGTGGTEHLIAEASSHVKAALLVYHDSMNSLPALLEVLPVLRSRGVPVQTARLGEPRIKEKLELVEAAAKLRSLRLGIIGGPSPWLVYSRTSSARVRERIGAGIVTIGLEELVDAYRSASPPSKEEVEGVVRHASRLETGLGDVSKALRLHAAIREIARRHGLDGLTIRCFDVIERLGTTACLSLALLNTEGFPAACEGDIPSLIAMSMSAVATGFPGFMANPVDLGEDEAVFAHCSSPLLGPYSLHTHFESGIGVGVSVTYEAGTSMTVLRLSPDLDRLRIGVGTTETHRWRRDLCRTQVKLRLPGSRRILEESMGNHYILLPGNHAGRLEALAKLMGISVEWMK